MTSLYALLLNENRKYSVTTDDSLMENYHDFIIDFAFKCKLYIHNLRDISTNILKYIFTFAVIHSINKNISYFNKLKRIKLYWIFNLRLRSYLLNLSYCTYYREFFLKQIILNAIHQMYLGMKYFSNVFHLKGMHCHVIVAFMKWRKTISLN